MLLSAITRFLGLGFIGNFASFMTPAIAKDENPESDDEDEFDYDFTNDYQSDEALNYFNDRVLGAEERMCFRFTPEMNYLPTFSFKHNEIIFTDDYKVYDELVNKILTGYAGEEGAEIYPVKDKGAKDEANEGNVPKREVKVRDFATEHPTPTVFHAHKKALQFHYLRYLHKSHVFDFPALSFTPEDAHRLLICGFIEPDDWDDCFLLSVMLTVGAYKCHKRVNPLDPDSRVIPPRGPWTISANSRRPTEAEIEKYICETELVRYTEYISWYPFEASERAGLTAGYLEHRLETHGVLGLGQVGIGDNEAQDVIMIPDRTYIPPDVFNRDHWTRHPGDQYCCYCADDDDSLKSQARAKSDKAKETLLPIIATKADSSDAAAQSGSTPPPEPETPETDSSSKSGSKKRARSPSPEGAEDKPSRSKRIRVREGARRA